MIAANIKKPTTHHLDVLQDIFEEALPLTQSTFHPIKFTYYNLVCALVNLLQDYIKSNYQTNLNIFLIDHFMNKKNMSTLQIQRNFYGLIKSWRKFIDHHEDAKLFLSLLQDNRNNKDFIRWFLKLRKIILKNISSKILQQIFITHSDALTICHMLFEDKQRTKMSKKINELFINLKRKMINTAKIDGAVTCEFFLNAKEELKLQAYPVLKLRQNQGEQDKNKKQKHINLSFSEEFAEYYQSKPEKEMKSSKNHIFEEFEDLENEWENEHPDTNFDMAKNEFKLLYQKDRDMDAKLQNSGIVKLKKYPEGWDDFLKTNQEMKEKLLHEKMF